MKNLIYILIFIFSITFINKSKSADIIVNGSGLSGTYNTISAGINAANPGDRILVSNQSFPYQEDTIFIDKSVTIMPYDDVSYILFDGHIKITLDSISDLTIIGLDTDQGNIFSEFNDTSRNSLSTVNIIDSDFNDVHFHHPKTSVYASFSNFEDLFISHGDVVGCRVSQLFIGDYDEDPNPQSPDDINGLFNHTWANLINSSGGYPNECTFFNKYIPFGNVDVYSDTINIIGNQIYQFVISTKDFALNIRNNMPLYSNSFYLIVKQLCSPNVGNNNFINNNFYHFYIDLLYCSNSSSNNFENVNLRILNNDVYSTNTELRLPYNHSSSEYNTSNITFTNQILYSYNDGYLNCGNCGSSNLRESLFLFGPFNYGSTPNPSSEFLNLDLSLNITGVNGGSYDFNNINPNGYAGFGSLGSSSKARITYLNLPTQIFDPSNIKIKAKAVHGN